MQAILHISALTAMRDKPPGTGAPGSRRTRLRAPCTSGGALAAPPCPKSPHLRSPGTASAPPPSSLHPRADCTAQPFGTSPCHLQGLAAMIEAPHPGGARTTNPPVGPFAAAARMHSTPSRCARQEHHHPIPAAHRPPTARRRAGAAKQPPPPPPHTCSPPAAQG